MGCRTVTLVARIVWITSPAWLDNHLTRAGGPDMRAPLRALAAAGLALTVTACGGTGSNHEAAMGHTSAQHMATASSAAPNTTTKSVRLPVPQSFGGTAHPKLYSGPPGHLKVTFVGTPYSLGAADGTVVPVEVWNGTSQTISGLDISGPAMSGTTVVGSGDSQDVEPGVLASGQTAFGMVFYSQNLHGGSTFKLTATASSGASDYANVTVEQANYSASGGLDGPGIVGTVTNHSTVSMSNPIPTDLYCFSSSGVLLSVSEDFVAGNGNLAPGAAGSYSVSLPTDAAGNTMPCPTFLVGSSGQSM